jgi:RNA polymerase sigma-70 factor (ECF subfamily)
MSEFGRLLEREIPALRRYARILTRDPVEADDLMQSCLVRALAKQHLWQAGTDLRRWLFTMLYRQRITQLRRQARERNQLAAAGRALMPAAAADPGNRLFVQEIGQAIAALPDVQRQIMRRVALDGMDYAATAQALGVPLGTVRSRLARSRAMLRRFVDGGVESDGSVPFPVPAAHAGDHDRRLAA